MKKVLTFGIFDLFHVGHLNLLETAKKHGDYLMVGVGSDESVRNEPKKKWKTTIPEDDRLRIVSSINVVDFAFIYDDYHQLEQAIERLRPDIYIRGDDWQKDFPGKKKLEELGVEILFLPYYKETSSTKIKEAICSKQC